MWNAPDEKRLRQVPKLYETDHIPSSDKKIYLHFFLGASDWYVAEYDGEDTFFGYVILNNEIDFAEWGYFSFHELKQMSLDGWLEVDCEKERVWTVKAASKIEKISTIKG